MQYGGGWIVIQIQVARLPILPLNHCDFMPSQEPLKILPPLSHFPWLLNASIFYSICLLLSKSNTFLLSNIFTKHLTKQT